MSDNGDGGVRSIFDTGAPKSLEGLAAAINEEHRAFVGTEDIEVLPIGKTEARELTDRIKDRAEELWHLLLEAYERNAHGVLGYKSWGDYFRAEFGGSATRGYELLDAGRVTRALESSIPEFRNKQPLTRVKPRNLPPSPRKTPKPPQGCGRKRSKSTATG